MSVLKKVFSDSIFSAFRLGIATLRGIAIVPLITNLLGASGYGIWATLTAFVGLITSTGSMHLHGSLIRYASKDPLEEQSYSDILLLSIILALISSVFVLILGISIDTSQLFDQQITNEFNLIIISVLIVFSSMIMSVNINFPRSKGNVRFYDLLNLIRDLLELILLTLIFFLGGSIIHGLMSLVIVPVLISIFMFLYIFSRYSLPYPKISNFPKYIRYGAPMMPKELSSSLLMNADRYIILYFLSPAAVGVYAVAHTVCKSLTLFTEVLNPSLYPTISSAWDNGEKDEISDLYKTIIRYYSIISIPALFGLMMLSEPLLTLFSTADIADQGIILVPILAFGFLLRGYDNPLSYILTATENTEKIGGAILISAILNVVMNILFTPLFGLEGAAVATAFSQAIAFIIIFYYSISTIYFPIPYKSIFRCLISSIVMTICIYLAYVDMNPLLQLSLYPLFGAAIYFIVLYLLGEFSDDEIEMISDHAVKYL